MKILSYILVLLPLLTSGQIYCDKIYVKINYNLEAAKINGDTIVSFASDSCTHFTLNLNKNGVWKVLNIKDTLKVLYIASVKNGKLNGRELTFYSNGRLMSFANYIENKLNKEFLKYYSNGQLNSKEYFNLEKPNGISNGYYEGGAKMWKKKFSNGRVIREKYWDENGNRIPAQQAYQIWMQKYPCS